MKKKLWFATITAVTVSLTALFLVLGMPALSILSASSGILLLILLTGWALTIGQRTLRDDVRALRGTLVGDVRALRGTLVGDVRALRGTLVGDVRALRAQLTDIEAKLSSLPRTVAKRQSKALGEQILALEPVAKSAHDHDATGELLSSLASSIQLLTTSVELVDARTSGRLDQLSDDVQRNLHRTQLSVGELSIRLDSLDLRQSPEAELVVPNRQLYYLSYQIPREVEATWQLYRKFDPEPAMPVLGGWALSPVGLLDIIHEIERHSPETVLEVGGGTSSLWIGYALRDNGGGHLYTLEHNVAYAGRTREEVRRHGLQDYITVIEAPLVEHNIDDAPAIWYSTKDIDGLPPLDLVLVDGPPESFEGARANAMPILHGRLSPDAQIFVDDFNRARDRSAVHKWLRDFPDLELVHSSTQRQAAIERHTEPRV